MRVLGFTAVLVFALCFGGNALAANIAPNPSFTLDVAPPGGAPDNWGRTNLGIANGRTIAIVTRDTSTFASTPASMQVQTGPLFGEGAQSDCITLGIGNGTFSIGFSYLVTDTTETEVDQVGAVVVFYADNACDPGGQTGGIDFLSVTVDRPATMEGWPEAWTTVAPVADAITGNPLSARVFLTVRPSDGCTSPTATSCFAVANFDDVIFDSPLVTSVRFQSAAASRSPGGVTVRWRTAAEFGTLGFNVYRERAGKRQRVNRVLIPGGRGSYSFVDRLAPRKTKLRYWIEEVVLDGRRSWHGPLRVGF